MSAWLKKLLLILIPVLILFYFGFSFYVSNAMTSRLSDRIDISPKVISENFEEAKFTTSDQINLKGWFFPANSDKAVVMVAGLLPNRVNTEYLGLLIVKELLGQDYNVLIFDTRAHGESSGERVGYGSNEGQDVVAAVDYLKSRGFSAGKIALIADSTGAISTLMVVKELKDVGALVIDSAATNFQTVISTTLWKEKRIPTFFHPTIFLFNKLFFGVDLGKVTTLDKVQAVPERKFLFLHAAGDKTIPLKNSQELFAHANPASKLVVFPNGEHIETYKSDPFLYRKEVFAWLETELGN